MSFDRDTRTRLASSVGKARDALKSDAIAQLRRLGFQEDGTVLPLERIDGLTEGERAAAEALRELLDHLASVERGAEGARRRVAYDRLAREIGFTTLNRLVALRMAEERGLIVQAVGRGLASQGFQVFERVANGALGGRAEMYRAFLESLYDEVALDLPLLFDRSDPRSWIFPGERCLEEVLGLLNDPAIAPLWKEDEAIGWVYQYYNDPVERKKMRESQAPRSSRELAVRNQFFTPRYVVEFLTDNTLGRIWYEMRQGDTRLVDECRYLVRRYDEVFLSSPEFWERNDADARFIRGETDELAPFSPPRGEWHGGEQIEPGHFTMPWLDPGAAGDRLIQFAHYNRPFNWPDDPRRAEWESQLEKLAEGGHEDPADGRTQDLWDVLLAVSRANRFNEGVVEAHGIALTRIANEIRRRLLLAREPQATQEQLIQAPQLVPHRPKKKPAELRILDPACGSGHFLLYAFDLLLTIYDEAYDDPDLGPDLQREFPDRSAYDRRVPAMILHNNLHGIDIDPRACQIAALAVWLRAQRRWQEMGLAPQERPRIRKTHIVCAEPMPGERDLLEEYLTTVDLRLRPLVRTVWEKMQLAGEAGSLLKIEEEIRDALRAARVEAMVDTPPAQMRLDGSHPPRQTSMTLAGTDDIAFWDRAEAKLLDALRDYVRRASNGKATQRRLFAEDAAQGLAFIDVCRKAFDVVLMNPPFGEGATEARHYLLIHYPDTRYDLFSVFVERGLAIGLKGSLTGVISSRNGFFLPSFRRWREEVVLGGTNLRVAADLGQGILDAAMVETASYVLEKR